MQIKLLAALVLGVALAIGIVYIAQHKFPASAEKQIPASGKTILYWHDPMVPDQHFDKPGKSPFMDMELVPKYADNGEAVASGVTIATDMRQNLGIRTATVTIRSLASSIHASGRVAVDEHRLYALPVRTRGYVEKLYVRAVGDRVQKGQKLADIYSPELLVAQKEHLFVLDRQASGKDQSLNVSTHNHLLRMGMAQADIDTLVTTHESLPRIGLYTPVDGFITELAVREGASVSEGMSVVQVANLDRVWLLVNVPERDAMHVATGQRVEIQPDSQPGITLHGLVDYVYPELDMVTRSVRVRISLENPRGQLRPGMYAQATLLAAPHNALMAQSAAVIRTGTRSVVIVQEGEHFRPTEIITGREQDEFTEIMDGLHEGETVVVSGQFLIDSEASLSGVLARLEKQP